MKAIIVVIMLSMSATLHADSVKSFSAWKSDRVLALETKISRLQEMIKSQIAENTSLKQRGVSTNSTDPNLAKAATPPKKSATQANVGKEKYIESLQDQLKIEKENLSFAKELTIENYVRSYLIKQKNQKAAIQEAGYTLTQQEVVELLSHYSKTFIVPDHSNLSPTATAYSSTPIK